MKASIVNKNVIRLADLKVGQFAEGIDREKKHAIYVKTELRAAGGNVLSAHYFNLLNPEDQYPDKIALEQSVRVVLPGDEIRITV